MKDAVVPLFCTTRFAETRAFYVHHLDFGVVAEMPGYVELQRGNAGPRLAFMAPEEGKWPAGTGAGLVYCFQVEDADAEHRRLASEGVKIVEGPADRPWGERGFLAADPNGISLYFGHPLAASVESAASAQ